MSSKAQPQGLFDGKIIAVAAVDAVRKLDPRALAKNPVIFVTEVVSAVVTILFIRDLVTHNGSAGFTGQIAAWLWFTVLFANFAEAVAEGRGKAQADALRRTRSDTRAKRYIDPENLGGIVEGVNALDLRLGDVVLVEPGEIIPGDGEIVEGVASVNELAITGESAPVIRELGGDRSAVTGGTTVLSDFIKVKITAAPGSTFIDRMIALVEGAERQKTPNELALSILLSGLTLIFLIVCVTLWPIAKYSGTDLSATVLIALLVCLIPTTIGGLLSAIGIAGMDRLIRFNVIATSGRAVEAAGDVDTLLLDKTGTITFGNRMATEFLPVNGVPTADLAAAALASSLADETPEGRSIVALAKGEYGLAEPTPDPAKTNVIPFTAQTRISGVDIGGVSIRKGAIDSILRYLKTSLDKAPAGVPAGRRTGRHVGRHAARCRRRRQAARRRASEGRGQARHQGAIRGAARHGDPNRDGDRRQSDHRGGDRIRSRRRRFPRRSDAGGQAQLHPQRAVRRPAHCDVRRRHQRRAGARPGRRRGRDADRHAGGARSGQHGRSRLQSDQAHRDRRDRQAASDDPRLVDDLLDRQRRRQIFRDPARRCS